MVRLAPTPKDVVLEDGGATLYRFRSAEKGTPLLLVPSLINRWYVLDLRDGVSLAAALVARGLDVWCLDWGAARAHDRFLTWDDLLARLARATRRIRRVTGAKQIGLLGYCMGGTLAGIHAALEPERIAALVNLAGPIDFSEGGLLARLVDPRWFDADAVAAAGNVGAMQMQQGFQALRPTLALSKWIGLLDRWTDPDFRTAFEALERWANDNVDFPGAAYATYIRELYQENRLVRGEHRVGGRAVDLAAIRCPVLTVAMESDTICPPPAAQALLDRCGSRDKKLLRVPGGHVGAVVGNKAAERLYPALGGWLEERLLVQ